MCFVFFFFFKLCFFLKNFVSLCLFRLIEFIFRSIKIGSKNLGEPLFVSIDRI